MPELMILLGACRRFVMVRISERIPWFNFIQDEDTCFHKELQVNNIASVISPIIRKHSNCNICSNNFAIPELLLMLLRGFHNILEAMQNGEEIFASNDWFLYKIQHWVEMGYCKYFVILEVETKGLNKLYPIKSLCTAFKSSKKYKLYISTRLKNAKLLLLYEKNIFDYLNSLG